MLVRAALLVGALLGGPLSAQETVTKQARVVVLFDVSASMHTIDGPAKPGVDPARLPSRLDLVISTFTDSKKAPLLAELLKKAPVTAYRFGATLDQLDVAYFDDGLPWTAEHWSQWLKGDKSLAEIRNGTAIVDSALTMLRREKDSYLQAVVIVSDGRGTSAFAEELDDFLAEIKERNIPVFTIGVGGFQALPSLSIGSLQAPQEVRAADKFQVRVPILSHGLDGEEYQVILEAQRVSDGMGQPVARQKWYLPGPKVGRIKGAAIEHVEFDIDLAKFSRDAQRSAELDGTWHFTARVPSHPREPLTQSEHVSDPVRVVIRERKLRVLLVAGGPTREYQFLRTICAREELAGRLDLWVHLQNNEEGGIHSDQDPQRILKSFPDKLDAYDVVVAFDPDWTKLKLRQLTELKDWVANHGGGFIFQAGNVHTFQLARPGGFDLTPLLPLIPVVLRDHRLHGTNLGIGIDTTRPHALQFTPDAKRFSFLKLDDFGASPTAGWNGFFFGDEKYAPKPGDDKKPTRGFYNEYPVERIKPDAETIAAFAGPKQFRIGAKTDAFKDQAPYLVTMPHGAGRSLYIGSGEFWRLRAYQDGYHERLWLGMIRHVAGSRTDAHKHGMILAGRTALAGIIGLDAHVLGSDGKPLPANANLMVEVHGEAGKPRSFELNAQAGLPGWYAGSVKIAEPGAYTLRIAVPGTTTALSHRLSIRAEGELDDVRTDFAALFRLATVSDALTLKLPAEVQKRIEAAQRASVDFPKAPSAETPQLFFRLDVAGVIPEMLEKLPPKKFVVPPPAKKQPEPKSVFKEKKPAKVLIIDGAGARGRDVNGDGFFLERAIVSIPKMQYKPIFADELIRDNPAKALERDELDKFGAILLVNVPDLSAKQLARLESFSKEGGGVGWFLGPCVDGAYYRKHLYKDGKGIFPAPLEETYYPGPTAKELPPRRGDDEPQLLLRDDLFGDIKKLPIFGPIFEDLPQRLGLEDFPVRRYFKIPPEQWKPTASGPFELASMPSDRPIESFQKAVLALTRGKHWKAICADVAFKKASIVLERDAARLEAIVGPAAEKTPGQLARALDDMLLDAALKDFWRSSDAKVRNVLEAAVRLRHDARYGDPLIVAGKFGQGRTVAVMTTAGKEWNDFAGGSTASIYYLPFVWEMLDYLTGQEPIETPKRKPAKVRPPQIREIELGFASRKPSGKNVTPERARAFLITPDAHLRFRGLILDDAGILSAEWIIQVSIEADKDGKAPPPVELRVPLTRLREKQAQRALSELTRDLLAGKRAAYPDGFAHSHALHEEAGLDLRHLLKHLKAKDGEPQGAFFVKVWLSAQSASGITRSEMPMTFLLVSENELLVNVNREQDANADWLENAVEKLQRSQVLIAEQIGKLRDPSFDREIVSLRVSEVQTNVRGARERVNGVLESYGRTLREFEANRVRSASVKRFENIADLLESALGAKGFAAAEDALHELSAALEKKDEKATLERARAVSTKLDTLTRDVQRSLDLVGEGIVEAKLIEILLRIEQQQRENREKIERMQQELLKKLLQGL